MVWAVCVKPFIAHRCNRERDVFLFTEEIVKCMVSDVKKHGFICSCNSQVQVVLVQLFCVPIATRRPMNPQNLWGIRLRALPRLPRILGFDKLVGDVTSFTEMCISKSTRGLLLCAGRRRSSLR